MDSNRIPDSDADVTRECIEPGAKFGSRIIVEDAGRNDWGQKWWLCRCDCGWTANVVESELRSGRALSCIACASRARKPLPRSTEHGICQRSNGRWQAQTGRTYVGTFATKDEAIRARQAKERDLGFGR